MSRKIHKTESLVSWHKRRLSRPLAIAIGILFSLQLSFAFHQNQEKRNEIKSILNSSSNIFSLAILQNNRVLLETSAGFLFKHRLISALCITYKKNPIYTMPFSKNDSCKLSETFSTEFLTIPLPSAPGYNVFFLTSKFPSISETLLLLLISAIFIFPVYYFVLKVRSIIFKDIIAPFNNSLKDIGNSSYQDAKFDASPHRIDEINDLIRTFKEKIESIKILTEKEALLVKDAAIGRIIAQLSHDMRAPLGAFERLLGADPSSTIGDQKQAIRDSLNRLNSMIESLRHSEVENLIKKSSTSINFLFGRENLQGKATEHHVKLIIPDEDFNNLWIDPMKVERAWMNLASNAIEAAKSFVSIEAEKLDTNLLIHVIDDGPGVSDDILPKLFQRGMTSGKAGGTGLGLAYVRQVMQGHGGDVTYRRENGLTIFECFLPHAVERKDAESLAQEESFMIAKEMKTRQVSVCFTPKSYGESIISILVDIGNPCFKFTSTYSDSSDVLITNDEDLAMKGLDEGKETIKIQKVLSPEELVSRLVSRLNIKS